MSALFSLLAVATFGGSVSNAATSRLYHGKVLIEDGRTWCDGSSYRTSCDTGAQVGLPNARLYVYDSSDDSLLKTTTTLNNGSFVFTVDSNSVYLVVDWAGLPTSLTEPSFRVYYTPTVTSPSQLNTSTLTGLETESGTINCLRLNCDVGDVSLDLSEPGEGSVASLYLDMNNIYMDDLYDALYYEYCRDNVCNGVDHAVVSVIESGASSQTGNLTSFIVSSSPHDGTIYHEFGHSLQFWAHDLEQTTVGPLSQHEAWANFIRLAYFYDVDESNVIDYDGANIESGPPQCVDGSVADGTDPDCAPEEAGINWRMAFWDLYDDNQETTQSACEDSPTSGTTGDRVSFGLGELLDAWAEYLDCADPTADHCIREGWTGGGYHSSDPAVSNIADFIANLSTMNPSDADDIDQTGINHACLQDMP